MEMSGNFGSRRFHGGYSLKTDQEILLEWHVCARRNRIYILSYVENAYSLEKENLLKLEK